MISKQEMDELEIDNKLYICYDMLVPISKERILATHGKSISLIDIDGNMIVTYDLIMIPEYPDYDYMIDENTATYSPVEDFLLAYQDGKVGVIDYDGNIVVQIEYRSIEFTSKNEIGVLQ